MVSAYTLACLLRSFSKIHIVSLAGPIHPDPPGAPSKPRSCSGDRLGIKQTKVSAIHSHVASRGAAFGCPLLFWDSPKHEIQAIKNFAALVPARPGNFAVNLIHLGAAWSNGYFLVKHEIAS